MAAVLILEDDDDLREILVDTLQDLDHEVRGVPRGEQAIELFQQSHFDLLVVDIRMAGPDGLETVAYLRQLGILVPTLVMTGYADQADPIRALRLGAKEYLLKPFALDEFIWSVERILEDRRQSNLQKDQEQGVYRSLEWLLASAMSDSDPALQEPMRACRDISARLELSASDSLLLLLTIYLKTQRTRVLEPEKIPEPLQQILANWGGNWDSQTPQGQEVPLLSRVGSLLQNLSWPLDEASLRRLQQKYPGRFDPYILEKLGTGLREEKSSPEARQILDLIHILLACGDRQASRKAFEQLLSSIAPPAPERVFAHLGLAELSRSSGPSQTDPHILNLLREVEQLSPLDAVTSLWDSARWLVRLERPEVMPLLRNLGNQIHRLSSKTHFAQLTLLAWVLEPKSTPSPAIALAHMMLPENLGSLRGALDWLLPKLLELGLKDPALTQIVTRLCRQEPQVLAAALREASLPVTSRLFVAQALEGLSSTAQEALQQLEGDADPKVRELARTSRSGKNSGESGIPIQVLTFGGFELWVGSFKVPDGAWRGSRVKHLAAHVAISPKPVHAERLLELFWPESEEKGRRGLQSALTVIRGACRDSEEVAGRSILVREAECVGFPEPFQRWVDCHEFDSLLQQAAQSSNLEQRCNLLQRAIELYKGPFLEGCFLDWALDLQNSYEQLALQALLELAEAELALQRWLPALQSANRALRIDPFHVRAAGAAIKSHMGAGKTDLALQFFETFNRRYQDEMGQGLAMDQFF